MAYTPLCIEEQTVSLYKDGLSSLKIAAQLGIQKATVLRILKRAGVERRSTKSILQLDKDILESFLSEYKDGATVKYLASRYGIATSTIREVAIEQGVYEKRTNRKKPFDLEKAVKDYEEGLTLAEVGQRQGVTAMTVLKYFRKANVDTKKPGDYWKLGLRKNPTKYVGHTDKVKQVLSQKTKTYFSVQQNREKASRATTKAIQDGRLKPISQIEEIVAQWLIEFNVKFERQVAISDEFNSGFAYCVDFVVGNTVIEVNGTYWHSDPRFYPLGAVTYGQKRVERNYKVKRKIINERGMKLIEVWEYDLKTNPEETILECLCKIEENNFKGV